MASYQREVWVDAPLSTVWDFYSTTDGLEMLTPAWMNLRVEAVRGPDGEADPEVLVAGTQLRISVQPFGVGPRQRWVSVITRRMEESGAAVFEDEMTEGPFPDWKHVHRFYADDGRTLVRDRVEYEFPGGAAGRAVGPFAVVGFEPMFAYRHRKTKRLLER